MTEITERIRDLTEDELAVLADVVEDPEAWWAHVQAATNVDAHSALAAKLKRHRPEYVKRMAPEVARLKKIEAGEELDADDDTKTAEELDADEETRTAAAAATAEGCLYKTRAEREQELIKAALPEVAAVL